MWYYLNVQFQGQRVNIIIRSLIRRMSGRRLEPFSANFFFFRVPGSAGWKSIFMFLFSRLQIIHLKFLSYTCREIHKSGEQKLEIAGKTAAPVRVNIDKKITGVATHLWMRKRCSKGFLEQGSSSPCLIASNTSNTVTRRHTSDSLPAPPALYLAGSTSSSTQLIGTAEFAVSFRKY